MTELHNGLVTFKSEIEITPNLISNILVTAFDGSVGGCWYWAKPAGENWLGVAPNPYDVDDPFWVSARVADKEADEPEPTTLTVDGAKIHAAIQHVLDGHMGTSWKLALLEALLEDHHNPDLDADDCDMIVQYALFGCVMYS